MRTINQFINLYNSVLSGISMEMQGHTISSDGINWLVDGASVDTLKNKLKILNYVIEKCELAKELMAIYGLEEGNMYDEYFIIFDSLDGMIMLVSNTEMKLNFIYMLSTSVAIERIDKGNYSMRYEFFDFEGEVVKRKVITGKLSKKAIESIAEMDKKESINVTQNFFYDMLFDGVETYKDLVNVATIEAKAFEFRNKLTKRI